MYVFKYSDSSNFWTFKRWKVGIWCMICALRLSCVCNLEAHARHTNTTMWNSRYIVPKVELRIALGPEHIAVSTTDCAAPQAAWTNSSGGGLGIRSSKKLWFPPLGRGVSHESSSAPSLSSYSLPCSLWSEEAERLTTSAEETIS